MPVLLRPVNNFLGQVIGNASEGKYNAVKNSSSREVTFQKWLNSGITLFLSKNSNKSQTFATGPYQRVHEARSRRVVWLWEPEYIRLVFVILHLLTNMDHFRKRLLKFSGCCECCHSPSIFVSIHMPLVTLVGHSDAFAKFVRYLQGVCSVRRFPFLVNICQRHIHSVFIQIAASSSNIPIIRKKMARRWQRW